MSNPIPQFSAPNAPFVGPDGRLTFSAHVFLREIWLRAGGAIAPSNTDLAVMEYADAGIEENVARTYALDTTVGVAPICTPHSVTEEPSSELVALRSEVDDLRTRIAALEQGYQL